MGKSDRDAATYNAFVQSRLQHPSSVILFCGRKFHATSLTPRTSTLALPRR